MNTSFAMAKDGKKIAYDINGDGPAIILLHGGRQTRSVWHEIGYVEKLLKENFQVVTIDLRGNGESDKPTTSYEYGIDMLCEDVLAVADACRLETFTLCGYSYGGNIGRYLASISPRIKKFYLIGIPFGVGAPGGFGQFVAGFRDHWVPILDAQKAGTLDDQLLTPEDKGALGSGRMPLAVAWMSAMLDWPLNEPINLRCPTLWIIGSKNELAMANLKQYEAGLEQTHVAVSILEGLNHEQELLEIDRLFPLISSM